VNLQPRTAGGGEGVRREDVVDKVATDLLSKIPLPFDLPVLKKKIGIPTPVQVSQFKHW
jgi:dynein heavy chain